MGSVNMESENMKISQPLEKETKFEQKSGDQQVEGWNISM